MSGRRISDYLQTQSIGESRQDCRPHRRLHESAMRTANRSEAHFSCLEASSVMSCKAMNTSLYLEAKHCCHQRAIFRRVRAVLALAATVGLCSCLSEPGKTVETPSATSASPGRTLLDADWRFHRGDVSASNEVVSATFDDSAWQKVRLPHDYVLDGTYANSPDREVRNHGYLPYPVAWYRKNFSIPKSDQGKMLRLDFDGVFRDSEVWLNGEYLGRHPCGYTPFSYDITKLAKVGGENVITVRVDPREWEGWWYEGGGIYRHVYLTALAPVHVAQWGTHVVSKVPGGDEGAHAEADLTIQTEVENDGSMPADCQVVSEIVQAGKIIKTLQSGESLAANQRSTVTQSAVIQNPKLWSLEKPNLYQLRTTILEGDRPANSTTTTFGIRTIRYDAEKGFFLNGKHVEIQGVANHQDFSAVGIAVPDNLQSWRVAKLKDMGCNAWRTAHNPPNEAVLDACDRLGMMVMDENRHLGDTFAAKSPAGTTATNFSDLEMMIRRDRNHPSIIMWSMCNEEKLAGSPEGIAILQAMIKDARRFDDSRPYTSALVHDWPGNEAGGFEDIIGVNYNENKFDAIHSHYPRTPMFGSEETNQKTTRGEYADNAVTGMCSGYNMSNKGWLAVINRSFMCGSFTWTGFDYRGEPNPYGWPEVSNNTGLMDLAGFPKDRYYYFESCWSDKPMVHLMPDGWNPAGQEGKTIRVVAFSNARQVELFLNGRSLGAKNVPHDDIVEWKVPYQAGRLEAKAYTNGKTVAAEVEETTGAPARIVLSPACKTLRANGEDAVVVPVSILDDKGRLVPDASNRVTFQPTGGGRIVGVGNGNPADHDTDRASERNAFHGHCIAVIQAGTQPDKLQLTASSPGLASGSVTIQVKTSANR
jgi:beta-galactosidase